jgi:hypothetical protein
MTLVTHKNISGTAKSSVKSGETTLTTIHLQAGPTIAKMYMIHFAINSAFIEPAMRLVLQQVADHAAQHPDEKLLIVGHTDLVGSAEYNQALSERRARSAYAFLTVSRDDATRREAWAEWNMLRLPRARGEHITLKDNWGTREYQFILQEIGFYIGNIDGIHGPKTCHAAKNFQQRYQLPITGTVDDRTWYRLIQDYLEPPADLHNVPLLEVPAESFFCHSDSEEKIQYLKWLGCGEQDPTDQKKQGAWRPHRRVEFLFIPNQSNAFPFQVPEPLTFQSALDLATLDNEDLDKSNSNGEDGSVNPVWAFGESKRKNRCTFTVRMDIEVEKYPDRWKIELANSDMLILTIRITRKNHIGNGRIENIRDVDNQLKENSIKFALIAPNGEYLHANYHGKPDLGEFPYGSNRGLPIWNKASSGQFFQCPKETRTGVYILEVQRIFNSEVSKIINPIQDNLKNFRRSPKFGNISYAYLR